MVEVEISHTSRSLFRVIDHRKILAAVSISDARAPDGDIQFNIHLNGESRILHLQIASRSPILTRKSYHPIRQRLLFIITRSGMLMFEESISSLL